MLSLEEIPDDTFKLIITVETTDGEEHTFRIPEGMIYQMRRETNEERIKRYCKAIEQLVDEI